MNLSFTRFALALVIAAGAQAATINFTTNNVSGSCFTVTLDNIASGCQTNGVSPANPLTFTNTQGDSASLLWLGFTNSIGFAGGPVQNVNYGRFTVGYTSNAGDLTPVTIPQLSFLMIIKEIPVGNTYSGILADFTGTANGAGSIGPSTADLKATFSPTTVTDGLNTTFSVSPVVQALNGPGISLGQTIMVGQVQNTAASTPESSTWLLLSIALPLLLVYRQRTRMFHLLPAR